jgi:hypothetical protein
VASDDRGRLVRVWRYAVEVSRLRGTSAGSETEIRSGPDYVSPWAVVEGETIVLDDGTRCQVRQVEEDRATRRGQLWVEVLDADRLRARADRAA